MTWAEAEPPALPPPGAAERLRLAWRAPLAVLWLALCFAVFLACRGADLAARRVARRRPPALAPWLVLVWARGALRLLGLRPVLRGAAMAHPGALVANHSSWLDIVTLQAATRVFFVSKAEVAGWPVIGAIGRAIGTMFIERRATEAKRQTAALHARLARGDRLAIFPEGTSSDGRQVLPFKTALFAVFLAPDLHDALWVQPVTLRYAPRPGLPPTLYGWWGDMDFGSHLKMLLMRSTGGVVEVAFHPPLPAAAFPDRKPLAAAAEASVRSGAAS
ncbi:1-acyl-sn-glycerol-3-phosphate acyltransferase [Amaricoccus sp.]|uniref:lysophospholipid acyltransferase family protein n=1 Tax=Amaricoccus sp. TaxID=1872485 RepID=UPI001B564939|nr:lysophospholipid acyltransferase family protein [Amaricoccus sp.]MBP7000247.1 1-acyl-sn-glycerol-3-phosphate acyltransferase [Amaricoccus sp.]